jgi:hypothetical protein
MGSPDTCAIGAEGEQQSAIPFHAATIGRPDRGSAPLDGGASESDQTRRKERLDFCSSAMAK